MQRLFTLLTVLFCASLSAFAQDDSPYARFGYEGKVLRTPQERQQRMMLVVPNPDTTASVAKVGLDPAKQRYYLFDKQNKVLASDTLAATTVSRFLSVDPLAPKYPWYTPYQFAGNKPIRFIDLDGMEEANPSIFTTALNYFAGSHHLNRLNDYLTENKRPGSTVIVELPNDTYVVVHAAANAQGVIHRTYAVFRKARAVENDFFGTDRWYHAPSDNDDTNLTEEQFESTPILGAHIIEVMLPVGGAARGTGAVMNGAKNGYYTWRQTVGVLQKGARALSEWKAAIRIGVLDAMGVSKDLIKKGMHLHFEQLGGLELSLKPLANGGIGLGALGKKGAENYSAAVKVFNQAMANPSFRETLLINMKAAQQTLQSAGRALKNAEEAQMALDKAHELNYLIKSVQSY